MDNNEFDKIFEKGLSETKSFDGAEESWQKLQPRLHPPRKRRRFIIWPFLLVASVFFGITTYWFYNQSATLKEDMAELNEQLRQQQKIKELTLEESAKEDVLSGETLNQQSADQQVTAIEMPINTSEKKTIKKNIDNQFINIKKPEVTIPQTPTPDQLDTPSPTPFSNSAQQEEIAATDINTTSQIKEAVQDKSDKIQSTSQTQKTITAFIKLINKFWLLEYEREDPVLALLENPQSVPVKKKEEIIPKRGFSVGINGGLARDANISIGFREDQAFNSPTVKDGFPNNFTYDQYGVHADYTLNKNWQLHSSINRERSKIFYESIVTSAVYSPAELIFEDNSPAGLGMENFDTISAYLNSNYSQTEVIQKNWLFNLGVRRRIFSIKKLDAYLGTYATLRVFQKQAISYSGLRASNSLFDFDSEVRATASGSTDFAITPAFIIGSPIGKHLYWNLEANYNFHLSSQSIFQLPELGAMLGIGYKF